MKTIEQTRLDLLSCFTSAVEAVGGKAAVERELLSNLNSSKISSAKTKQSNSDQSTTRYPEQFHVIAIGKAADAMLGVVRAHLPQVVAVSL